MLEIYTIFQQVTLFLSDDCKLAHGNDPLLQSDPKVTIISIGIGSRVNQDELSAIASDKNHTFRVSGFEALNTIKADLTTETCNGW